MGLICFLEMRTKRNTHTHLFGKWPKDWKMSLLIPISKGNAKEYSNYQTIELITHASKVILKLLEARFQQYVT